MSKMLSIAKYEYRMQVKRIAGWIVLLFVLVSSMMDCLPVASNMARIEFWGTFTIMCAACFPLTA